MGNRRLLHAKFQLGQRDDTYDEIVLLFHPGGEGRWHALALEERKQIGVDEDAHFEGK